ncbi:DUF4091 domain-containing protein [Tepidibacter formicigenes]|uniref:Glycoside hydrolase 123 catalytic domain-containing protein n=1 Tax=Tepidibacter formicigenes DSM 15518 TaxID=1123349 RepID=A0A1M6KJ20_9FIRM|nr:DUF4091 domain-containing protein [Tepidibacter formicigenes]SHJ58915.1 protein of unknown function [Tepidibacter formicigenes DSM 15518]
MNIKYALLDSSYKHIKYSDVPKTIWGKKDMEITIAKQEKFAFQLMLNCNEEIYYSLDKNNNLSWKGIKNRLRLELNLDKKLEEYFNIAFLGYIKDDTGILVSDPILREPGLLIEEGISQMIWIEGVVPSSWENKNIDINIDIYSQCGFGDEEKIKTVKVKVNVMDICLSPLNKSDFYLDLWQHPSNWARMYKVPLWSKAHWDIIKIYLEELASMGEKVITAIVSDFPWAGQSCYKFSKNASNLFEHNMIKIIKNKNGKLLCDFSILDRYIEICIKLGIDEEIDLFGLLGNWDAFDFGNPIKDYKDPIRLNYYDEGSETFKYISTKKELKVYITSLFNHLIEKGWWNKVYVMSDEPNNPDLFNEYVEFINSCSKEHKVFYKTAVHDKKFMKEFSKKVDSLSLSAPFTISSLNNLYEMKKYFDEKLGKFTWYVCCFPQRPNNFISSPFIENRLIGWFTYYFGLDGFLRWDYAIWPDDPWNEPSYKFPSWKAGDMFFVYPGKDLKPVRSVRWENLRFGIQDYQLFKLLEEKGFSKKEIEEKFMEKALGKKEEMKAPCDRSVDLNYKLEYDLYNEIRKIIMEKLICFS